MVRRARLLDDTSSLYGGIDMPSIVSSGLKVSFRGEMEEDAGGVTRDLFTSYWRGMLAEWFSGEAARVPCVPASRIGEGDAALLAAGRVLTHGLILTQSLPPQLSRVHLLTAYDGRCCLAARTGERRGICRRPRKGNFFIFLTNINCG